MSIMQAVLDLARIPLNDAAKARYPDLELLGYANSGIELLASLRPDLRFGQYGVAIGPLAAGGTFPFPTRYIQSVADYVTYRAETKDDEHINSGRAALFFQSSERGASA